ncbi:RNA-binding protein 28, partial [Halocaridina rubra]
MADLIKGAGENVNVKQFEPTCLVVTHLPKDATKREIESFFNEIGTIRKCHLVRDKDWEFRGMAYVAFARWQDAAKAKEMFQKKPFRGYSLRIKFSRTRKKDLLKKKQSENQTLNKLHSEHFDGEIKERVSRRKAKDRSKYDVNKESRKMRERRIIVRNLSFKATESILEDHFSPYGKIVEVQLPRKDGKLVGIAFLQFETKLQALKAIKQCNMKPLLGRHVAVDIAVPKKKYESQKINLGDALDIKQENIDIKEDTEDAVDEKPVKTFPMDVEIKKEETESEENNSGLEDEEEEDFDDDTDNESIDVDSDEDNDEKSKEGTKQKPKSRKLLDNDVSDGSTIFIKNLSFDAEDDDVLDFFSRFGDVHYVKICVDPLTEHPRGTAFVKFKKKTSADACLAAEADPATKEEFNLLDRQMHVMRAINKNEAQLVKKNKETEKVKDKRNLYLAREGVIRQGTRAAVGVSEADMRLRYSRENAKRRMLKNLNIFVSKTRLCINNIPEYYTEQQLRRIFAKHSDPNAKITEVRIMKNFQDLDDRGQPKSRGYGFVSFKEHEHALNALRKFNNNPHIFSEAK